MVVKLTNPFSPKSNEPKPLASPAPFGLNADREFEYQEQAAQDEYEQKIREEYKEEMAQEILKEQGEDYVTWVPTDAPDIQEQITNVARALGGLVKAVKSDKQLLNQPLVMTEIERKQLIAILEATLVELKAPYIDRGRLKVVRNAVSKGAEKAVTNKASEFVQAGFSKASEAVSSLCDKLADSIGSLDFWS